jgi:cell division protein FtsZ
MLEFEISGKAMANTTKDLPTTKLIVLGVGGAGNNTLNALINAGRCDYTCVAVNTDVQALDVSHANHCVRIGLQTTKGRGAGADPLLGKIAAEEDLENIINTVKDADLVFLVGGLGGGTGSGALPVIARALKELNIVNICIVTKPFGFEGKRRMLIADQAIELLKDTVDTLVTIPNEKLFQFNQESPLSFVEACNLINGVIGEYVCSIGDILTKPGYMNVDFSDVKTVIKGQGTALMGTARAEGPDRAVQAAHAAITSHFLDITNIRGARSILVNITGNHTLTLQEVQQAASRITEDCDEHANIIIGSVIDEAMGNALGITVIATGFDPSTASRPTVESRYSFQARTSDIKSSIAMTQSAVGAQSSALKEPSIALTKEHSLRDVLPGLEKRLKDQYHPSTEELDTPAFLRKLSKELSPK